MLTSQAVDIINRDHKDSQTDASSEMLLCFVEICMYLCRFVCLCVRLWPCLYACKIILFNLNEQRNNFVSLC